MLEVVTAALAADTARIGSHDWRPVGIPRRRPHAARSAEATPEAVVTAGVFRLVGSPIRIGGYEPDYRHRRYSTNTGDVTAQSS